MGYYNPVDAKEKELIRLNGKRLLIVDGHGLAFRAFYALPELNAPDGTPTNAVLGFFNMFFKIRDEWKPDLCGVIFDAPGPTFRHELFPEYKAGRKPTPPEFKVQVPLIHELLQSLGVFVAMRQGVEADDVLASVACSAVPLGIETMILSSDKDILQVIRPGVSVLRPLKGISTFSILGEGEFLRENGFPPSSMSDYLALLGDKVDNVPGLPGVGEKTARELLAAYGTLEGIYGHVELLKPALRKKFEDGRDLVFRSRELVRLRCGVQEDLEAFLPGKADMDHFISRCRSLGFSRLLERVAPDGALQKEESPHIPSGLPLVKSGLQELLASEQLFFCPRMEGRYPLGLKLQEVVLMDQEGKFSLLSGEEAAEAISEAGKKFLVMPDFKEASACMGTGAFNPSRVWDFKSAHYLLHPDRGGHRVEDVLKVEEGSLSLEAKAHALAELFRKTDAALRQYDGLRDLMMDTDIPLIPVLVEMERYGIGCSIGTYRDLERDLSARIGAIEEDVCRRGGGMINLNSPKQVAWLLFEKLGLPSGKETKTGLSTDISVLEGLSALGRPYDEVPNLLIEHRELSKMLSGFVQPLRKAAEAGNGVIHGTFEPAVTGTGRLSSRDPNLQNLPSFGDWSRRMKEGLVPQGAGRIFVGADYSQIELRVLAHLSGDARLRDAFSSGRDIHAETASWVFGLEGAMVTPELRRVAKMINFGLLYGMSSFGLAQRLAIGRQEAGDIVARYFQALPGVKEYLEGSYDEARKRGYTRTFSGRIRPLDEVPVSPRDRGALRRVAVNTPIQGTAADIARRAMVLFAEKYSGSKTVRLVLQVHDSLVCECAGEDGDDVEKELRALMERASTLSIPLKAESKKGKTLADV